MTRAVSKYFITRTYLVSYLKSSNCWSLLLISSLFMPLVSTLRSINIIFIPFSFPFGNHMDCGEPSGSLPGRVFVNLSSVYRCPMFILAVTRASSICMVARTLVKDPEYVVFVRRVLVFCYLHSFLDILHETLAIPVSLIPAVNNDFTSCPWIGRICSFYLSA